ncbi:TonB-dependent receptor domain-containing protein [Vibrio mexicanus]|uniref:TonB-dependent receptor domain-containing protein n=1 Tax=Vibrio mexicanus TaxID=1004326 RepID=UPI00063CDEBD|nr:TonB-dependent receptor [Vibrio mexicanus]
MKKTLLAVAVASLLPHAPSLAQESNSQQSNVDETMVVTANRFESRADAVTAPINIITKEEIAAIQAVSLSEVLQRLPGIQIVEGGGYGKSTEIYVRGTSSRHQLFMVNGVRIGSATLGSADISSIPLTGVERIEVLRGPRAAVYGSDAIGGVINIITTAEAMGNSGEIGGGVGSKGFYQANAAGSVDIGNTGWARVAVSTKSNDGFSTLPEPYEQDKDGFEAHDLTVELGAKANEYLTASLFGYLHEGKSDYDNGYESGGSWINNPNRVSESSNFNVAGKIDYRKDFYASELSLAKNRDRSKNLDDSGYESTFQTQRLMLNWIHNYQLTEELNLGGGYEYQKEEVYTNGQGYDIDNRSNNALYALAQYTRENYGLEGSVRTDDSNAFGRENTWQLGAFYQFIPELAWSVSGGTAYKAPTFNDLYYPDTGFSKGNPNVLPEESKHIESSLYGQVHSVDWRATGYRTEIDNLISWVYDPLTFVSSPENVNEALIKGFELELGFYTGDINHQLSYDYTDAKDTETGKQLQRRAKHNAKWNASYILNQWQFDLSTLYRGKSYDDASNTNKLDSYTLVDFALSYNVTHDFVVRGKVSNLFDEEYQNRLDFYGYAYNTPGREYYVNATYQF